MATSMRLRAMHKEYGERPEKVCGNCCNCHYKEGSLRDRICIAYGEVEGTDCTWRLDYEACGLYNRPFRGLRPKRTPLVTVCGPKPKSKAKTDGEKQISIREAQFAAEDEQAAREAEEKKKKE